MPNDTVRELRPAASLALFYSIDAEPGFGYTLCADETLEAAVFAVMFGEAISSAGRAAEHLAEARELAATLREKGEVRFEDGWLELARGLAGVAASLSQRCSDARADARCEDRRRYEEHEQAALYKRKWRDLLAVVTEALGARVVAINTVQVQALEDLNAADRPGAALNWARATFSDCDVCDRGERASRFLEEAIELAHAEGLTIGDVQRITERVDARPAGDPTEELGQAALTLEILAANRGLSASALAAREFDRVRTIPKEEWDRRHGAKVALGIASGARS